MTRSYSDMNQHDSLYKTARQYPGGLEALAQRMGISVNVLRNKLSPGIDTHHITFEEVSEITEFLNEAKVPDAFRPLHAMLWRHGLVGYELPTVLGLPDVKTMAAVCRVMKEVGEVAAVVSEAHDDKVITAREIDTIEREFQQAVAALCQWRDNERLRFTKPQIQAVA